MLSFLLTKQLNRKGEKPPFDASAALEELDAIQDRAVSLRLQRNDRRITHEQFIAALRILLDRKEELNKLLRENN